MAKSSMRPRKHCWHINCIGSVCRIRIVPTFCQPARILHLTMALILVLIHLGGMSNNLYPV